MDSRLFFDTVVKLREAQKWFFSSKSPIALKESKRLEREIDQEIARVQKILALQKEEVKQNPDGELSFLVD